MSTCWEAEIERNTRKVEYDCSSRQIAPKAIDSIPTSIPKKVATLNLTQPSSGTIVIL